MTREAHQQRHELLHRMLDELLADFLLHNRGKVPSKTTVWELMEWSNRQMKDPEEKAS